MTPVQRLQASREAITAQWSPGGHVRTEPERPSPERPQQRPASSPDWWGLAEKTIHTWWQHHPAHPMAQIAQPLLAQYAREKPWHLVGIAAGVGAAAVLLKPWRHIPLGAALAARPASSDLSALLAVLLSQHAMQPRP